MKQTLFMEYLSVIAIEKYEAACENLLNIYPTIPVL